jgi:predicted negative regulator of RcsB-dependent stress response
MAEEYLTDDEQLEAVKRWIAENGVWLIGGVIVGAALLFGYRYYQSSRNDRALAAAAQFDAMSAALERSDRNDARRIADALIKDYGNSPYADQAELTLARLFVDEGQLANAVAPLTQVMTGSKDTELRHIARLRLARVLTDQGKPDEAIKTLSDAAPGAFAARYHEVRGDAFYAKQDFHDADVEYKEAVGASSGRADSGLLELKIADLSVAAGPAATPTADIVNKAKP